MAERFVDQGDLLLWTESFGSPKNPAILLIMGIGGQAIVWPDRFCQLLADNGFFVIRYDSRDTGKSSKIDYSKHSYGLDEMVNDAAAILDAYNIKEATLVGSSMGGTIAQLAALKYPKRVSHLVLIMSTPDLSVIAQAVLPTVFRVFARLFWHRGSAKPNLPLPKRDVISFFRSQIFFPLKNQKKRLEAAIDTWRVFSGGGIFDEREFRTLEENILRRSDGQDGFINHSKAILRSLKNKIDVHKIIQPTLIIHGELDPVFPLKHAEVLAQEIPHAYLEIIPDMGHILPSELSEKLASMIVYFLKSR